MIDIWGVCRGCARNDIDADLFNDGVDVGSSGQVDEENGDDCCARRHIDFKGEFDRYQPSLTQLPGAFLEGVSAYPDPPLVCDHRESLTRYLVDI